MSPCPRLDRRAGHGAIGAKDAAIAGLWPQPRAAAAALVNNPAGVGRHRFHFCRAAMRAGDQRLIGSHNPNPRWSGLATYNPPRRGPMPGDYALILLNVIPGREQSSRTRNPDASTVLRLDSGSGPSGRPGMTIQEISLSHSSSLKILTPNFCASLSLEPAPGPATT
jgi:hypothetical protein